MLSHATDKFFPDALEFIDQRLHQERLGSLIADIRNDPASHPLETSLLKAKLLPYQLDGIAFAAGAGRAVLADDMGLGKTIQGIGVAELLAQQSDIKRGTLVVIHAGSATFGSGISFTLKLSELGNQLLQ